MGILEMINQKRDWLGIVLSTVWLAFLLLCVLLASSCSTFKYENVDTVRKGIVVANVEVRAANLLLQDLIKRNVINKDDGTKALDALQSALDELKTAHQIIKIAGDPFEAQAGVERANASLTLAIAIFSEYVELE